tara:strand:- start:2777 stop:3277 length:501 start_codon:yes stop_codon:yes gene_type:complete
MADLTSNINLLQPSGFKITIDRQNYPNLEFFAQSISHPSISGDQPEQLFRGQRVSGTPSALTFGDLSVIILVDENMSSYTEMQEWLFRLVNGKDLGALEAKQNNVIPSRCDIQVSVLTSHNNTNKTIIYRDAFPIDMGSLELEVTAGETNFITYSATFKYSRFEIS